MIEIPLQAEVDAYVTAKIEAEITDKLDNDKVLKLLFFIHFDMENRVRALKGEPIITQAVYKQALIDQYKTL